MELDIPKEDEETWHKWIHLRKCKYNSTPMHLISINQNFVQCTQALLRLVEIQYCTIVFRGFLHSYFKYWQGTGTLLLQVVA